MDLISTIINELVNTDISLTSPLLKTQVLASRIKNQELLNWVTQELNGYSNKEDLPSYRTTYGKITGTYLNGNIHCKNQALPIAHFGKKIDKIAREITLPQSLQTLESFNVHNNSIGIDFNAEIIAILQNSYSQSNPYLQLISAKCTTSIGIVKDILSIIRSRLLGLMLKIEEELGSECEIENIKSFNKEITWIMNNTIINGDGNFINNGDSAKIKSKIIIRKNNKESLTNSLKEKKVSDADINELLTIIDTEHPKNGFFGAVINQWIKQMMGKALDGTWQIGIGAAGGVLAEAINHYYGIIK